MNHDTTGHLTTYLYYRPLYYHHATVDTVAKSQHLQPEQLYIFYADSEDNVKSRTIPDKCN
jgi:hypothetical protein